MATLKCKMCGGELELTADENICECTYCGTKQTVPTADNDKKITLFDRANRLRMKSEFDKAASVYESIVTEFPEEAEAYWGLCLCKYGIEYVDDPGTGKKVPTCHRTSFEGIFKDTNFELAQEYSDGITRSMYREEAKEIDRLQKAILEIAQKEEPFDIFICYKETDENGGRTKDSVRAQEIYNELTKEGYKVFFSRITLEDKLGEAYEPYIFSALNSSKIMLAIGTSYDNYNAVWVKNEWSRFLQMMKEDSSKKLIPCYSDIDAYDMPEEFSNLQGQDMAKIGFLQDLLRGIGKILSPGKSQQEYENIETSLHQASYGTNINNLLSRGFMSLEDKEWDEAIRLFDNVLNENAKSAEAYLGMMLATHQCSDKESYTTKYVSGIIEADRYFKRANQFASGELLAWFDQILQSKSSAAKGQIMLENILAASSSCIVCLNEDGTVLADGNNRYGQCDTEKWQDIVAVFTNNNNTYGLKTDGTVVACGENNEGQCNVSTWKDIASLAVAPDHVVGLRNDGTVVATGWNGFDQCNVKDWSDIVSVVADFELTVGLKADGSVVAVGGNEVDDSDISEWTDTEGKYRLSDWKNIKSIFSNEGNIFGIKTDGTVKSVGQNLYGSCEVSSWENIIDITGTIDFTVGLISDGTIVAVGNGSHGQSDVKKWRNIRAIASGMWHTVGLKADGTVVACGENKEGQCNVSDWKNIVRIIADGDITVGLQSDGHVLTAGRFW